MRIVATSDFHGFLPEDLPDGDVLTIAGDVCPLSDHKRQFQAWWLRSVFAPWLDAQVQRYAGGVLWIAGNHDFVLQESRGLGASLPGTYLEDTGCAIDGLNFHGTPWTPTFGRWAFMKDEADLSERFALIGRDVDVLISHGPPLGVCDLTEYTDEHVGSRWLRTAIESSQPRYVFCGHIHEGYGGGAVGESTVLNVSLSDLQYRPVNPARVVATTP